MQMPGFTAEASMYNTLVHGHAVMDQHLLAGVVVPALPPRGQGGGDGGPGSGGGSGYYNPAFAFKNPLLGAACCDGIWVTCSLGCSPALLAGAMCQAGCSATVAACYNGQVSPCNSL